MNRAKMKKAVGCIVTMGLTIFLICGLSNVLERKIANIKYTHFFEEEEDFDVLFFGTSHMKYGILPMELWHDYGIVSYNLGTNLQLLPTTYWQMENVLEYTSPKLVVIDCFFLTSTGNISTSAHDSFDGIPFSKTKLDALSDLIGDGENGYTYGEFLWNYSIFHNRWNELEEKDFKNTVTDTKGGEYMIEIESGPGLEPVPRDNKLEEDTSAVIYLQKMIEDCQKRGIEVLLVYMPVLAWEESPMEANRVYEIAEQYGVNYVNFLDMDIIHYGADCSDDNHMNLAGTRKVTDYLGQYIMEHYDIADQRGNEAFADWDLDYEAYKESVNADRANYESLDYYMLYLHHNDYLIFMEMNNHAILNDDYYCGLFESLGVNPDKITEDTDFLVIQDAGKKVDYFEKFRESENDVTSDLGTIQIFASESGTYGAYLNGEELFAVTPEQSQNPEIRIVVVDKSTKEVTDQSCFSKRTDADRHGAVRTYMKE